MPFEAPSQLDQPKRKEALQVMLKITTAAAIAALVLIGQPAFAKKAPLPAAGETPAAAQTEEDALSAAIDCLEDDKNGPGLIQGSEEEARSGNAHFTVLTAKNKIGAEERRIAFYKGLRQGSVPGVDTRKVDKCMTGFGARADAEKY